MNDSATLVQRSIWALITRTRGGRGSAGLITNGALSVPPLLPLWINVVWRGPIKTLWDQTFKGRHRERKKKKRGSPLIRVRGPRRLFVSASQRLASVPDCLQQLDRRSVNIY